MTARIEIAIDMLDAEVRKAIEHAEKTDGYRYGAAFYHGDRFEQCFVSVDFYPSRRWYIRIGDGDRQVMTPEIFDKVKPLQL